MRKNLTKRLIDSLKGTESHLYVWDTQVKGFGVRVTKSGAKSYVFQYRMPGKGRRGHARRITIGRVDSVPLAKARNIAANHVVTLRAGGDPFADRDPDAPKLVVDLVARFLSDYLPSKKRPPRPKTMSYYESLLRCHVVPALGPAEVDEVMRNDVEALHTSMRDKPYMANRVVTVLGQAFDYAEVLGWRTQGTNPTRHIERYRELRRGAKKEVMLTAKQMGDLLKAIDEEESEGADPTSCAAIRVAFWTGWRISEVLQLEWSNIDFDSAATKLLLTKTSDEEYRQMPSEALQIVKSQDQVVGCPFVFPGRYGQGHLTTVKGPWLRIRERAGLDNLEGLGGLRLHDLRHNVVSWDISRGVSLEIAGKNVGHRSRDATEVYAHFAPDALKRAADERAKAMRKAVDGTSWSYAHD